MPSVIQKLIGNLRILLAYMWSLRFANSNFLDFLGVTLNRFTRLKSIPWCQTVQALKNKFSIVKYATLSLLTEKISLGLDNGMLLYRTALIPVLIHNCLA